jgi:hypothetical protein
MKNKIQMVIACAWLATSTVSSAANSPNTISAPVVPEVIKAPSTDSPSFAATAKGVQIYECRAKKDNPAQFEWVFKAPEAELFDRGGKKMGKHYGGPTWEANDGSRVLGELKARADGKDTNAIPWLLLGAKKHEGEGVFSKVTSIQRLDTVGGKAPAGGCEATGAGKEIRVPYTATYYFYVATP